MQNNWVLLQGRLCHTPNYSSTKKGLHKVAFRLAVPRPPRTTAGIPSAQPFEPANDSADSVLPPLGSTSDYVTVIIIGKPAWDFKQLDLQTGAAVRVQGRLRSWDVFPEDARPPDSSVDAPVRDNPDSSEPNASRSVVRDCHIEVIAEKVEPLNDS
jgi:hypothetical protein